MKLRRKRPLTPAQRHAAQLMAERAAELGFDRYFEPHVLRTLAEAQEQGVLPAYGLLQDLVRDVVCQVLDCKSEPWRIRIEDLEYIVTGDGRGVLAPRSLRRRPRHHRPLPPPGHPDHEAYMEDERRRRAHQPRPVIDTSRDPMALDPFNDDDLDDLLDPVELPDVEDL